MVWSLEDWRRLLAEVDLESVELLLDAGGNALCNFAPIVALARERGVDLSQARWNLGLDPLSTLARDGSLPLGSRCMRHQVGTVLGWVRENMPLSRALMVSTEPYHQAGAGLATQLGILIATTAHYLSLGEQLGLPLEDIARSTGLRLVPGRELFPGIAMQRAARRLWSRLLECCGFSSEEIPAPWIHVINSRRTLTRHDSWNNALRATTQTLAGVLGGADAITTFSYDEAFGKPSEQGRRLARNTQTILAQESRLDQVLDPAGGSYAVEALTDSLCEEAWTIFQAIQQYGGMPAALTEGWLHGQLAKERQRTLVALATRQQSMTGLSSFPAADTQDLEREPYLTRRDESWVKGWLQARSEEQSCAVFTVAGGFEEIISAAADGVDVFGTTAALGDLSGNHCQGPKCEPLPLLRDATQFERLRDRADELRSAGLAPRIVLLSLREPEQLRRELSQARACFTLGGFEQVEMEGLDAFHQAPSELLCLVGKEEDYRALEDADLTSLRKAGALRLLRLERGETDCDGYDGGISSKVDVIALLNGLQEVYG